MTTTDRDPGIDISSADDVARRLVRYFESGSAPEYLFAPDVFADLTFPRWRIQTTSADEVVAARARSHPCPGSVRMERLDHTPLGFVLAFEERWRHNGQHWYSREIVRADVTDGRIVEMAVYCTGDWDGARQRQHRREVALVRP